MIKELNSYQQGTPILMEPGFARQNLPNLESYLRKGNAELLQLAKAKPKFNEDEHRPEGLLINRADFNASAKVVGIGHMLYLQDQVAQMDNVIVDVYLEGVISKFDTCETYGTQTIAKAIKLAADMPNVSLIRTFIDSPGGSVSGTQTFTSAIRYARQKGKITSGYANDGYACSAAYWGLCEHEFVYAAYNTDYIGSIGVMITLANWKKFYEGEGLEIIELYSKGSDLKNADVRDAFEGNTDRLMAKLNNIRNEFVSAVKTNREGKLNFEPGSDDDVFRGDTYSGKKAKALGLIDDLKPVEWITEHALKVYQKRANGSIKLETEKTDIEMKKITLQVGTHDSIIALLGIKLEGDTKSIEMDAQDLLFNLSLKLAEANASGAKALEGMQSSIQQLTTAISAAEEQIVGFGKTNETITGLAARIEALEKGTEKPVHVKENTSGQSGAPKPGYDENGRYVGVIRHPDSGK